MHRRKFLKLLGIAPMAAPLALVIKEAPSHQGFLPETVDVDLITGFADSPDSVVFFSRNNLNLAYERYFEAIEDRSK